MTTFKSFRLAENLQRALDKLDFTKPTPIQEAAIPLGIEGKDLLATAQTGTGKTLGFGIPTLQRLIDNQSSVALIVAPTRELAHQIADSLNKIRQQANLKLSSAILVGGEPMHKQIHMLNNRPRLLIGTPGRIQDHMRRGSLSLKQVDIAVFDEVDRMLDMGFRDDVEAMMSKTSGKRQTLMFSATMQPDIEQIAKRYLQDPERIAIKTELKTNPNITHLVIKAKQHDKFEAFSNHLKDVQSSVIVFVNTKRMADKLLIDLAKDGHHKREIDTLHGDMRQSKRNRVMKFFRNGKTRVLIATDVAARGLDVPNIDTVINYDLPKQQEDYVHRTGRTGRAGCEGCAVSLVTQKDYSRWADFCYRLKIESRGLDGQPVLFQRSDKPANKNKKKSFGGRKTPQTKKFGYKKSDKRSSSDNRHSDQKSGETWSKRKKFGNKFEGKKTASTESRSENAPKKAKKFHSNGDKPFGKKRNTATANGAGKPARKKLSLKKPVSGSSKSKPTAAKPNSQKKKFRPTGIFKKNRAA